MMRHFQIRQTHKAHGLESGFTLMEIIVATGIFVTVVSAIIVTFSYVLQINRRVQSVRQVAQGTRAFTDVLSREIRNGRIHYNSADCPQINYNNQSNQALAIETFTGEITCLYLDTQTSQLYLTRTTPDGISAPQLVNPPNFTINPQTFRFFVRPQVSPESNNQGIQPFVTILAEFEIFKGQRDEQIISYQTTISSDVYDLPSL